MVLRFALVLLVMIALIVGGHVYLYRRLVRDTTRDRRLRWAGLVLFTALALLIPGGRLVGELGTGRVVDVVSGASFVWMGGSLFLVLAVLGLDGVKAIASRVRGHRRREPHKGEATSEHLAPPAAADPERRQFLSRAVAGGAVVLSGTVASYGAWRAYAPPALTEVTVKLPNLPQALDGVSIVQLTDIHVGNMIERRFLEDLVSRANALKPDLVAITGDLVDGSVRRLGPAVSALHGLQSRFGTWFVTGNHEYYSGEVQWTTFLESLGIGVLRNRHVRIGDDGGSFDLIGVDDWRGGRNGGQIYDLDQAMAGRNPDRASVLLAHQPANFDVAAQKGVGLQLSGHTHGGQLFPFTVGISMAWEHSAGLYRDADAHIYVSRGCGFWGPPMRVGSPPELVKIVLTPA